MNQETPSEDEGDSGTIELPQSLIDSVEQRLVYTRWETPAEYVEFVLEEVLSHVESEGSNEKLDAIDESEVENRLEALGYLNE